MGSEKNVSATKDYREERNADGCDDIAGIWRWRTVRGKRQEQKQRNREEVVWSRRSMDRRRNQHIPVDPRQ